MKIHNSGVVTSGGNSHVKQIQIQSQPATQTIANAQVCLDSMAISDVDVRTNNKFPLSFLHIIYFEFVNIGTE